MGVYEGVWGCMRGCKGVQGYRVYAERVYLQYR